ncbi:hypothetical protein IC762_17860 [Bradyrhizobium genosp. L]|uniref:hypothetical protein n=1 Tax=Bradyrhizobium genosp. L TaxID=83637 RepID=UPI0018A3220E|nr:hypothetical protein [Bradyrhizobium genosp. L]QPF81689.1 hypothetical protein IC762_17860 [Bradyrhizobium genosp. L]
MNPHALIHKLAAFKGWQLIKAIDDIKSIVEPLGYSVNVTGGLVNVGSIDNEPTRLNVRIDADSIIKSFSIG